MGGRRNGRPVKWNRDLSVIEGFKIGSMQMNRFSIFCWAFLSAFAGLSVANAQVSVSFDVAGQTIDETQDIYVMLKLSGPSLLEVKVPYRFGSASTAVLDQDFKYPDTNEDGELESQSPIVFAPGETSKVIYLGTINDDAEEGDELLVLEIVTDSLSVAVPGAILSHTVRIRDNDRIRVSIPRYEGEFKENATISVPLQLSSVSASEILVPYTITALEGSLSDLNLASTYTSSNPLKISAGSQTASILISINNDRVVNQVERRRFQITLGEPTIAESPNVKLDYDSKPFVATVLDNDPIEVRLAQAEDENFHSTDEHASSSFVVRLYDRFGELTTASEVIQVPFTLSGTATKGDSDTHDYYVEDSPIEVTVGESSATLSVSINNDVEVEEDETVIITIGQPNYKTNTGDLIRGEPYEHTMTIVDNDPVTLSFGVIYSKDDEAAAADEDIEDVLWVPSQGAIVGEQTRGAYVYVFLSSPTSKAVEFDLEIDAQGSSATMFNTKKSDQPWDYAIVNRDVVLDQAGKKVRARINAGYQYYTASVELNADDQAPWVYGQPAPADKEADESVKFRISNINTDSSSVNLGEHSEFTLTIRDMPDIDVTALFADWDLDTSAMEGDHFPINRYTGLHEVKYRGSPSVPWDASDFAGYKSYKIMYRTANFDASDEVAETNDPLFTNPATVEIDQPFERYVYPPFRLRYADGFKRIVLRAGEPTKKDLFELKNADIVERAEFLLWQLSMPALNDFEADRNSYAMPGDPMDFTVEFSSSGKGTLPRNLVDPSDASGRVKVFLSATDLPAAATGSSLINPLRILPLENGDMMLELDTSVASNGIQVQYLEQDGKWRTAQPISIQTEGASRHYWIDSGPPKTRQDPASVDFRLYRVIQN